MVFNILGELFLKLCSSGMNVKDDGWERWGSDICVKWFYYLRFIKEFCY